MNRSTLVLLPGLLCDERLWYGQTSALADGVHPFVANLTGETSISALAESVLAQVPSYRFLLAGHSMGGYVALELMRQAPDRVEGLALLNTSARPDIPESIEARRVLMEMAETDFPSAVGLLVTSMLHPENMRDGKIREIVTAMAFRAGKEAVLRQQRAIMSRIDSRPWLSHIDCPTLVLCGMDDAITPVAVHEEMAAAISGSHLILLERCGHLAAMEQVDGVTRAMRKWLGGETRTASHSGGAAPRTTTGFAPPAGKLFPPGSGEEPDRS